MMIKLLIFSSVQFYGEKKFVSWQGKCLRSQNVIIERGLHNNDGL